MRVIMFVAAAIAVFSCGGGAYAQSEPAIITENPAAYAQGLADGMALTGMRPLREAYVTLFGTETLAPNVESGLLVYERAVGRRAAQVARVIEDVTLSDALRVIYLYHYFGETNWVYTRIDFHAIGEGRWAVTTLAFADQWANIALRDSPGFRSSRR